MMNFYQGRIVDIITENDQVKRVKIQSDSIEQMHHDPGQYITIRLVLNGQVIDRPYSLCSKQNDIIDIAFKKIKSGIASNYLYDKLKIGDLIEFSTPEGRFTLNPKHEHKRNYLFLAAGIGITPIYNMIAEVLELEPKSNIVLIYSNKSTKDIVFKSELAMWESKYEDQFHHYSTLTEGANRSFFGILKNKSEQWNGLKGRISKNMIDEILNKLSLKKIDASYICGPENFNLDMHNLCIELGIPKDQIHREFFHLENNKIPLTQNQFVAAKLKYKLDGKTGIIEVNAKEKLLDALLRNGVQAPHSCSSGACASCVAQIKQGQVHMDISLALDEDEINRGFILTCQSHPLTAEIEIEY